MAPAHITGSGSLHPLPRRGLDLPIPRRGPRHPQGGTGLTRPKPADAGDHWQICAMTTPPAKTHHGRPTPRRRRRHGQPERPGPHPSRRCLAPPPPPPVASRPLPHLPLTAASLSRGPTGRAQSTAPAPAPPAVPRTTAAHPGPRTHVNRGKPAPTSPQTSGKLMEAPATTHPHQPRNPLLISSPGARTTPPTSSSSAPGRASRPSAPPAPPPVAGPVRSLPRRRDDATAGPAPRAYP